MHLAVDPGINDSLKADYKFFWVNPISLKQGNCTIFTYGQGKEIAIAIFKTMYPGFKIAEIEELGKVG